MAAAVALVAGGSTVPGYVVTLPAATVVVGTLAGADSRVTPFAVGPCAPERVVWPVVTVVVGALALDAGALPLLMAQAAVAPARHATPNAAVDRLLAMAATAS